MTSTAADQTSSEHESSSIASMNPVNLLDKVNTLIKVLESDLDACDFKWTLFVAAASSYKYDSSLKPIPSAYVANKVLNIHRLRDTISNIPALSVFLSILRKFRDQPTATTTTIDDCINDKHVDLLYWCLISAKEPTLKSIHRSNVSRICLWLQSLKGLVICWMKKKQKQILALIRDMALKSIGFELLLFSFESNPMYLCGTF